MVWEDPTPQQIQTRKAFENAITVAMAMGCSTNAIIHLIAQARRAGQDISLDDFEIASRKVPVIANAAERRYNYEKGSYWNSGHCTARLCISKYSFTSKTGSPCMNIVGDIILFFLAGLFLHVRC